MTGIHFRLLFSLLCFQILFPFTSPSCCVFTKTVLEPCKLQGLSCMGGKTSYLTVFLHCVAQIPSFLDQMCRVMHTSPSNCLFSFLALEESVARPAATHMLLAEPHSSNYNSIGVVVQKRHKEQCRQPKCSQLLVLENIYRRKPSRLVVPRQAPTSQFTERDK